MRILDASLTSVQSEAPAMQLASEWAVKPEAAEGGPTPLTDVPGLLTVSAAEEEKQATVSAPYSDSACRRSNASVFKCLKLTKRFSAAM